MKRIRLRHLIIVVCAATILVTLFMRSYVYEITEPHRQPASFSPSPGESSTHETIVVHFHERRPFYIRSGDEVHGLVADPIAAAFEYSDIPFRWQETPAKRQLDIIARNEDQSCGAGWFKTPDREVFARYTLPVYQDKPVVAIARADNEYLSETETLDKVLLERRLVLLVKEGYSYGDYIDSRLKDLAPRRVTTTAENRNILKMIENYRADYSFMTEEEAYDVLLFSGVKKTAFKLVHFSGMPPGNKRYIICSMQVNPEIVARLDSAIRFLQRSEGER